MLSTLSKSDPFKPIGCRWNEQCMAKDNVDCMASNVVYKIECTKCPDQVQDAVDQGQPPGGDVEDQGQPPGGDDEDQGQHSGSGDDIRRHPKVYIGQSGRSLHSRMSEHLRGLKSKDKLCPLMKHVDLCHSGRTEDSHFETQILHTARTNLSRLILEAEEISNHRQNGILNSKSEFRGTKIVRLVADREII